MEKLQTTRFPVAVVPPATIYGPVDGRKYTLLKEAAHPEGILKIGIDYEPLKDGKNPEWLLRAEWMPRLGEYVLTGTLVNYLEQDEETAEERFLVMQARIPELLGTLIRQDETLYRHVPWLLDAPIYLNYESKYPQLRTIEQYGTPRRYLFNG